MATDWTGLLLSIPIGIATGLATPPLQRWFQRRSKDRVVREMERAREELSEVKYYVDHPEIFTQYLVQVAIRTTFLSALLGVLGGLAFTAGQVMDYASRGLPGVATRMFQAPLFVLGQFAATAGALMIVNVCRPALSMWAKVRNHEEYRAEIEGRLAALERTPSTTSSAG